MTLNIAAPGVAPSSRLTAAAWSWAIFQGVRDPYVILVKIYIFAPFFVTTVVADPVRGQALVAEAAKYAGWLVMLTAPLLGAAVDRMGPRKPWLATVVLLMAPLMALLWFALPGGAGLSIPAIVAIFVALGVLFAYTETLHNALLVPAVGMARVGATSGLGLALGNLVSVSLLAFILWGFALPGKVDWGFVPSAPLFGLDAATNEPDRIVPVIVAVLFVLGTLPLLRFAHDMPATGTRFLVALRQGAGDLKTLFLEARGHRNALTYIGARMLFYDGLTALLIFGGVYAAGAMGWETLELLAFGMILSVFSVFGGLAAGWLDGRVGPKLALKIAVVGVVVAQVLQLGNTQELFFYMPFDAAAQPPLWDGPMFTTAPELGLIASGILAALTVTAAYSSSRTMLTRVVPAAKIGVFFGRFVIAGTATMWLGPLLIQMATELSGSQRFGLLPISGLLIAGLVVLQFVKGGGREIEDL